MAIHANLLKVLFAMGLFCALVGAQPLPPCGNTMYRGNGGELIVLAKVIGVEVPEQEWMMHYQAVKIFYLKIVKTLSGEEKDFYIRVAYGYHPNGQPQEIPPTELFDGSVWKFCLSRFAMWDGKIVVSRRDGDWYELTNERYISNGRKLRIMKVKPKCVATAGHKKEAIKLEQGGILKGYWLDWKMYEKPNLE